MSALETYLATNEPLLVADQTTAYNQILDMVVKNTGGIVFLDAPGGTGKMFVINLLLAKIRQQSRIAMAVASSGIAATLLDGGRTAHSAFKLPLNLTRDASPVCNISKGTGVANVLQECLMIVWNEYTMAHKLELEALDRTLQDLRGNNTVMGVGGRAYSVFSNIAFNYRDHEWLCQRAILAPKNDSVNAINQQIQMTLPGEEKLYKSTDTVINPDQAVYYPTEFLNSLKLPGLPAQRLMLKVGSPIMLLRNIDAPKLCNGTRLCVKKLMDNVIEATILTGCAKGEVVFIPRIPPTPNDVPFEFQRQQFPVRLAFAMTTNKAQDQSLKVAGIHLQSPCFSHGQLYVACSRVGTGKNLYILAPDQKTKNIVYKKALE
ncbi:ATP-dependent DNA helicase Pif1-like [Rhinoderma darwinii]|uniref:ATP-dependent DNA helicase Pif1-like n=1 Tax=Rhinoderma darwinii TaxID=43563 RepID=UPI003F673A9A